ncbi:MAG: hypothetical protein Fur0032_14180 [Terrimicrobiaceae bacterium]
MKGYRVLYEGRVQGVGFRWTTADLAKGYEVAGLVRNLPDGRVELEVCGHEAEDFLQAIRESALAGHIDAERRDPVTFEVPPRGFRIVPV